MKLTSRQLFILFLIAFALRLTLGFFAYFALPQLGTGSETQQAGYLFYDAFRRDSQAWELAQSGQPLIRAFSGEYESDQYGGLLWLSAGIYRLLGSHQPLAIVALAALAGALGGIFVHLAASKIREPKIAFSATLIFLFYPEAILQGASQMREPFLITFLAMFFYGLFSAQDTQAGQGSGQKMAWFWRVLSLLGMLAFSPGIALLAIVGAAGWYYFSGEGHKVSWKAILAALGVFVVGVVILSFSWENLVSAKSGPLGVIGDWARETAKWNKYILGRSSGIVQLLFEAIPGWLAMPFVAVYGILQPVLPAAIVEPSVPFWQTLGIARAAGWYALLPILGYAPFAAWKLSDPRQRRQWLWISALVWAWILIVSIRGGGDQWDNPRYRVILLFWMALLAAQTCSQLKITRDRWFLRILAVEAIILMVFGHWYLFRYVGLGLNLGIRNTLLIAIGLSVLAVAGDWMREKVGKGRVKVLKRDKGNE